MKRNFRGGVFRLHNGHHPVWAWTCYQCDRNDVNAFTGEDFGVVPGFSWHDAMQEAMYHIGRHREVTP